jgi:uncharacterized protein (TIGR02271 family)
MTLEELEQARDEAALVVDSAGDPVGELEAIYYDDETGEPMWLGVRTASEPPRRVLAPVEGAELAEESVQLAHEREAVEASSAVDAESIDAEAEAELREHYGLPPELVRYEEELEVGTRPEEAGAVRVRKRIESEAAERRVPREVEHAELERVAVDDEDSGLVETLPDGSISIPVFEEELVVTKRLVVRERVIVRKETQVEEETVTTEVRREQVEIDADDGISVESELP